MEADEHRDDDVAADLAQYGVIRIGDLFSTGARAMGESFVTFLTITLVMIVPAIVAQVVFTEWMFHQLHLIRTDPSLFAAERQVDHAMAMAFGGLASALLQSVLIFLVQAVLMFATVEFMAGRRAGVARSLKAGLSRAHIVIAVAILQTIAIGLGTLACIIPGILLTCVLYVSIPAAVVEDLGPIGALQRSAELTNGHRGTIFVVLLVLGISSIVLNYIVELSFGMNSAELIGTQSLASRIAYYALSNAVLIVVTMIQAAVAAVFYARVRGIRDGVDADAIAEVFA